MKPVTANKSNGSVWLHATIGAAIAVTSIGLGGITGNAIVNASGLTGFMGQLVPGILISSLAVILLLAATRFWGNARFSWLGLTGLRSSTRAFLKGAGIALACAVLVFSAATAIGWVTWGEFQLEAFLIFLGTNAIIALLLEALPEELALRGYVFSSLRTRYGPDLTVFLTTAVFVIVALALGLLYSAPAAIRAGDFALLSVSPEGQGLFSYISFIVLLGILLGYARLATRQLSVWTSIGAHLMVLTVNRGTVFGSAADTGLSMTLQADTAFLLVPAYMTLAVIAFSLLQPNRAET